MEPKKTGSENVVLKQRIKALESEYGLLKIDIEEIEIKNDDLIKQKKENEDQIEEIYKENTTLKEQKAAFENDQEKKKENFKKQVFQIKQAEANKYKEKCDLVDILEATVKNRDEEVLKLKTDLNNISSMKEF